MRGLALCPIFSVIAALASAPYCRAESIYPVELRCEHGVNSLGVDVSAPRLSWKLVGDGRSRNQSAYRVLVASSAESLAKEVGDLWDSGKVTSDQTRHVPYAGTQLKSSQQAFWKVRVWDGTQEGSNWSQPSTWTMGLLKPEDWKGKWICAPSITEALLLRKEFTVKPGLKRAVVHVSGLGSFEMFLNGAKVSDDLLGPGWTDFDSKALYNTYDVTAQLSAGTNAVGLALGNGMYHVQRRHRFAKFTGSFGPLRAVAHLRLEYADGSVGFVGSDDSWRVNAGPVTYNSIYGGEDFDARLEPVGWKAAGFDDSKWPAAVAIARAELKLFGFTSSVEPIRAIEVRQPVATKQVNGVTVYDLGQNTSYMPRLKVSGPAGSTVRLVPAEVVNADGSIQRSTMGSTNRGISWWQYTLAGDSQRPIANSQASPGGLTSGGTNMEEWFPQFYYVGCRYLEARFEAAQPTPDPSREGNSNSSAPGITAPLLGGAGGGLPRIESLEGVVIHADAAVTGEFECSNPMLNRIRDLIRWAQRANMVSVLTDCPHREKLGWIEQYHLNGPAIRYEFDMARMFTKGMNDMAEAQTDEGMVPNIAPEYTQFNGSFRSAAEWGAAFILVPWQQYEFNADVQLLERHYPAMKRYFAYLESRTKDDILSDGLGDWFDVGPKKSGASQNTPPPITASAFYFYDAKILAQIAGVLGYSRDEKEFVAKAERIRASYNAKFFNPTNGTYATGSQCANALPLVLGIAQPEHRATVLAALVKDLESRGYATTAGDVGFRFVLRALADGGRSDVVFRLLTQEEHPGYAYMLKKGETSLTEAWDANLTTSHNHFMLGQATEWFYHDLAGIQCDPAGPGFKKIVIKPAPVGDLTWAKASYDSPHGDIVSDWRRESGKFTLKVTIPVNTTATVMVPGKSPTASEGAQRLREEDGKTLFSVGSGQYEFTAGM
jgi:alpha-L-rhamnosidase